MSEESKNVVKNTNFANKGDWINRLLDEHCTAHNVGAVEEVKDDDGKVVTRGKKGKSMLDLDALKAFANENAITVKSYPNPGMYRMNVGNMLRAAARKRGGLVINGTFNQAPDDFEVNEVITENPDGTKVTKATEDEAA